MSDIRVSDTYGPGYQTAWHDVPFLVETKGHARAFVGTFFDRILAALIDGHRGTTQSGRLCPDVQKNNVFFECKAVGRQRTPVIGTEQIDDYIKIAAQYTNQVYYCLWLHSYEPQEDQYSLAIQRDVLNSIDGLIVVPVFDMYRYRQNKIKTMLRVGEDRHIEVIRFCKTELYEELITPRNAVMCFGKEAHGLSIPAFPIYADPSTISLFSALYL